MASRKKTHPKNAEGDFFVDSSCIDCDACRAIAPQLFVRKSEQSVVGMQPNTKQELLLAQKALVACPVNAIGSKEALNKEALFPEHIEDNVYYLGYHSKKSYGAASYLIVRKEGNILIDSPRLDKTLLKAIEKLGGIRYMFCTHMDDVADHHKYQKHFNFERIIFAADVTEETQEMEIQLQESYQLDEDTLILHQPGHTQGSGVLLYKNKFLFTGDHLAYNPKKEQLYAFKNHCWYSWAEQIHSMDKLLTYTFEWVLPGHGRRFHASKEHMHEQMQRCIEWMIEKS